jgi:hypothetical protein
MTVSKRFLLSPLAIVLGLCFVAGYGWFHARLARAQPTAKEYTPSQILANQRLDRPLRARFWQANYLVLDAPAHRIVELDSSERFVRQIGRFGTGPQEFSDPTDFAVGRDGKIYVAEAGNRRLTILDPKGSRIGGFQTPQLSLSVVVNSKNEILLNQPGRGFLLTAYGSDGTVKREFGALHSPPPGFSVHPEHDIKETYNRVSLALDPSDNIYVAWRFEARVQKYSSAGQLVWDIELSGREADDFRQRGRNNTGYFKYNGATIVLSGIAYGPPAGLVYVLFPSRTLYVLDERGNMLGAFFDTRGNVWPFNSITANENGILLFTDTSQNVFSIPAPRP